MTRGLALAEHIEFLQGRCYDAHMAKLQRLSLEELERQPVEECLADNDGNRTTVAAELEISVRTLQRKLKAWKIGGARTPGRPHPA